MQSYKEVQLMKKLFILPIMALLVFLCTISAFADDIFADKDTVKVYAEMDKESEVLKTLKGGERAKLLSMEKDQKWAKIEVTVESEKKEGFTLMEEMSLVMPSQYCNHQWTEWTTGREATCTEGGGLTRSCPICGIGEWKETDPLGHEFGDWTVTQEPTCTAEGMQTRTCSRCGAQEGLPIEKKAHTFGGWTVTKAATCTAEGTKTRTCSGCGLEETQTIEKTAHAFGDWTVTKAATCTAEGTRTRTCSGLEETQTIEKAPHDFEDWKVEKQPTCTAEGKRARKCKTCGFEESETMAKVPHTYGKWDVTKKATCTKEGERKHTCSVCGQTETEKVDKLPHDFEEKILKETTDHSAGVKAKVCKACGLKEKEESFDPEGTMRRGDSSEGVRELQQLLVDQNYLNAGGVDGVFGGGTEKAVMEFQHAKNLTADGVA